MSFVMVSWSDETGHRASEINFTVWSKLSDFSFAFWQVIQNQTSPEMICKYLFWKERSLENYNFLSIFMTIWLRFIPSLTFSAIVEDLFVSWILSILTSTKLEVVYKIKFLTAAFLTVNSIQIDRIWRQISKTSGLRIIPR